MLVSVCVCVRVCWGGWGGVGVGGGGQWRRRRERLKYCNFMPYACSADKNSIARVQIAGKKLFDHLNKDK